jgi:hypothetical protein
MQNLSLITCASALTLLTAAGAHAGQRTDPRQSIPSEIRAARKDRVAANTAS